MIRVWLKGLKAQLPLSPCSTNGNQYIRKPIRKMSAVRRKIFQSTAPWLMFANFFIEKAMAFPTAKRKDGKTRSVGVKPCQWACCKGAKDRDSLPGVLTMIMKHTVIPRKTSRGRDLEEVGVVAVVAVIP